MSKDKRKKAEAEEVPIAESKRLAGALGLAETAPEALGIVPTEAVGLSSAEAGAVEAAVLGTSPLGDITDVIDAALKPAGALEAPAAVDPGADDDADLPELEEGNGDTPPEDIEGELAPEPETLEQAEDRARADLMALVMNFLSALYEVDIEEFRKMFEGQLATWQKLAQELHVKNYGTATREKPTLDFRAASPISTETVAWLSTFVGAHGDYQPIE
jgi:hypothetical protein